MMDPEMKKQVIKIVEEYLRSKTGPTKQLDISPNSIKQSHIDGLIIFRGLLSKRPTNGDTEVQAYFATNNDTLYIWDDVELAWKGEVLT